MNILKFLILISLSMSAQGEVLISIGSKHFNTEQSLNEFNPGVSYVHHLPDRSPLFLNSDYISAGVYYNSLEKTSMYLAVGYKIIRNIGIEVGPVTGYNNYNFSGAITLDLDRIRLLLIPPLHSVGNPGLIGLQVRL